MDIVEFLHRRFAEDESAAQQALDRHPRFLRLRVWLRRLRWGLR